MRLVVTNEWSEWCQLVVKDKRQQVIAGRHVLLACFICGYVYDPAEHNGVAFEDLPDDWKCPRCRQPKEKFNAA